MFAPLLQAGSRCDEVAQVNLETTRRRFMQLAAAAASSISKSAQAARRLNGYVETILQKVGDSRDALLHQLHEFLQDITLPRAITVAAGEVYRATSI